jgi:hypothetical protein
MPEDATPRDSLSDESYRTYLESWRHSAEAKVKAHEQLDSYLLKLSAGALAVSLSPATGLFEASKPGPRWLLVVGWLLYLVTIGATMLSFRHSAKSCDTMVDIAYRAMIDRDPSAITDQKRALRPTRILNWIAIYSFLAALLLSVIYLAITFLA